MEELISVVVPIYGVEKYLASCVESICRQTYHNLEILLIDDGSPDRSGEIADELAKKDTRIHVIHKENGGLSDARNAGIDAATGEYITFVDSDDTIHPDMLKNLFAVLHQEKSDIACCRYVEHYEDEEILLRDIVLDPVQTLDSTQALKRLFVAASAQEVVACCKLYRKTLFSADIRFPKGKLHEDNFTTYRLYARASKISFLEQEMYFYLQRKGSITGQFKLKRLEALEAAQAALRYVKENGLPLIREVEYYLLRTNLSLIEQMILEGLETHPARKTLEKSLFNREYRLFTNPYFTKKTLLLLAAYKLCGFSIYRRRLLSNRELP